MANGILAASQLEMLSQAGTGITTIIPPATNTNRSLTLPDSTGTVATAESTLAQFNASGSAPVYAARAWVNFNGTGTVAIRASGNVSSITDNGTGQYTVNFTNALSDGNYAAVSMAGQYGGGVNATLGFDIDNNIRTTTAYRFFSVLTNNPTATTDIANVTMAFFR